MDQTTLCHITNLNCVDVSCDIELHGPKRMLQADIHTLLLREYDYDYVFTQFGIGKSIQYS